MTRTTEEMRPFLGIQSIDKVVHAFHDRTERSRSLAMVERRVAKPMDLELDPSAKGMGMGPAS